MKTKNTDRTSYFRFDLKSLLIAVFIFLVEVCIALFVDDRVIRPYGGDFLVVIMLYYLLKAFVDVKSTILLISVLLFAYAIEICQLFKVVEVLGMENNKLMRIVIGTSFSWGDLVAYTLGIGCCWFIESKINRRSSDI